MDAQSRVRSQVWPDGTGGYGATPRSSIDLPGLTNYLAGCGRTRLGRTVARWSARLWTPGEHFRRVAERDWLDGRDERDARLDTGGRRVMPWRPGGLVEVRWSLVGRFSRPFIQTVRILTGPHSQLREGHFAAGDRPAHERCGVLAMTFWAAHTPLSHTLRGSGTRKSPRELDRSRPNRRSSLLLNVCHVGRLHGVYIREELIHVSIILRHDGLLSRLVIGSA